MGFTEIRFPAIISSLWLLLSGRNRALKSFIEQVREFPVQISFHHCSSSPRVLSSRVSRIPLLFPDDRCHGAIVGLIGRLNFVLFSVISAGAERGSPEHVGAHLQLQARLQPPPAAGRDVQPGPGGVPRPEGAGQRHPVDGVISFDVIIDRSTNLLSRVYRPAPAGPDASLAAPAAFLAEIDRPLSAAPVSVIVFFHGGSFAHSSSNSAIYDSLCRRFVSMCGAVVVSVSYRRSPEFRFPCAYDDGWAALKWASTRPWLRSGRDSKVRIFLAGDSSGGNIAHNVALRAVESGIEISGNILLNPMFGGEGRKESELMLDGKYFVTLQDRDWYWRAFLPRALTATTLPATPSVPTALVVVAGFDLIRDWQLAYADGLKKAGQSVKLLHLMQATIGFYLLPNNNHFFEVMEEIRTFLSSDC
ncbi:unnamed protein product [Spirodela intermedia]|uniref:Alpha/beta hydrolase fold-3 domain-containing protein n=1 Tax=Spirodela intermedia TaxID=51605 RepID=A0A7I8I951_SPIIN|nr:unnamed protein product [Spirodela intermedia]CAA6654185.1 unnamed protein product [Spirodela intermedia]